MENTNNKHTEEIIDSSRSSDEGNNSTGSWIQWLFHEDSTDTLVEAAVPCSSNDDSGISDDEDDDLITRFTDEHCETNELLQETDDDMVGCGHLFIPQSHEATIDNSHDEDAPLEVEEPHVTFSPHVAIVSQDDVTFEELRDEYHGDMRSPSEITCENDSESSFLSMPEAQKFYTVRSISHSSTSLVSADDFSALTRDKVISINVPMGSNKNPNIISSLNDLVAKLKDLVKIFNSLHEILAIGVSEPHSIASVQSSIERLPITDGPTIQELDSTSLTKNDPTADNVANAKVENKDCNNDVWSDDDEC